MSSKLVKGGAVETQLATWQSVGPARVQGTSPAMFSPAIMSSQTSAVTNNQIDRKPIQDLEARIRTLETAVAAARQEGLQQGSQQGGAAVRQELSAQTDALLQRLSRTIEEIAGLRQRCRREAEKDIVQLALAIARRILHRELTIDPEALLGLVKAALGQLDIRELQRVRVHPEQAATVRAFLDRIGAPAAIEVVADPLLERGAAVFETGHGTLDASAGTQLAEIERGFTDLVRHAS